MFHPVTVNQTRRLEGFLRRDAWDYNVAAVHVVPGGVSASRLAEAISHVLDRHVGLRSRFVERPGGWRCQAVADRCPVETGHLPSSVDQPHAWLERARAAATEPFNLLRGPCARGLVLRLIDGVVFVVAADHACVDGTSMQILMREIAASYAGAALPAPGLTAFEYAERQADYLAGQEADRARAFWAAQFADEPLAEALMGPVRDFAEGDRGRATLARQELPAAEFAAAGTRLGVTPFQLFLTAVALALWARDPQPTVTLLSPFACRTELDTLRTVGWLSNVVPLRVPVRAADTLAQTGNGARTAALTAFSEAELPFSQVQEVPNGTLPLWCPWTFVDCGQHLALAFDGSLAREVETDRPDGRPGLSATAVVDNLVCRVELRVPGSVAAARQTRRLGDAIRRIIRAAAVAPEARVDQMLQRAG